VRGEQFRILGPEPVGPVGADDGKEDHEPEQVCHEFEPEWPHTETADGGVVPDEKEGQFAFVHVSFLIFVSLGAPRRPNHQKELTI
jgi:hypothetical protein